MQITHEEAHRLIQFKSDSRLDSKKESDLSEHLTSCLACRGYLAEIREAERILQRALRKQWDVRALPLQMGSILDEVNSNMGTSAFVTTRTALVSLIFMFFAFIAWQSTTNSTSSQILPGSVPLIPTPSNQYTATNTLQTECGEIRYIVQKGDTLESLAKRFSTTKEELISANHLTSDALFPSQELVIPYCGSTPTSTTHPPTFTITPNSEAISTTPG